MYGNVLSPLPSTLLETFHIIQDVILPFKNKNKLQSYYLILSSIAWWHSAKSHQQYVFSRSRANSAQKKISRKSNMNCTGSDRFK